MTKRDTTEALEVVRARRFELVDEDGTVVAVLAALHESVGDGASLFLRDSDGVERASCRSIRSRYRSSSSRLDSSWLQSAAVSGVAAPNGRSSMCSTSTGRAHPSCAVIAVMTDDSKLAGLDPFDILDREAARLDTFFAGLADEAWSNPSRCAGWSVRDVLGHLAAAEEYHLACLDGTVGALLGRYAERGVADIDAFNALGVADRSQMSSEEVLAEWRAANAESRRRFRERADGIVDTSVGEYPCRWQAFHVASELATHADDVGVLVTDAERDERREWRVRFSRFALAEAKPDLGIDVVGDRTVVSDRTTRADLDDEHLIEGVGARLDETSGLDAAVRQMLSTMS
jgi:uncharacterized protein (TIGR03083 family)